MNSSSDQRPTEEFTTARIRSLCREGFESSTPRIIAIARGETSDSSSALSIKAHDNLGKYGLGRHPDIFLDKTEWLKIVMEVTADHIPDQPAFQTWWTDLANRFEELR